MTPLPLESVETPAALVDVERMEANLHRVVSYARLHGLSWRPHVKTHKVPELAARQLEAGARGITVATLREAEVMSAVADDVLLAYPPVGASKLARLMALPRRVRLTVALDSAEVLTGLAEAARAAGRTVGVLVELDMGMRRVGVQSPEEAVALARAVADAGLEYRGVTFYPGHVRSPQGEQGPLLAEVSRRLGTCLRALEAAGLGAEVVSGGSTPTLWRTHEVAGLTEMRPGIAPLYDRASAWMGACAWSEVAFSVLATVVSTAVPGQAVIDAGSKALAKEELPGVAGYGALLERPEVVVRSLSEEHGLLDVSGTDWRPRVGEQVRVVPNHACVAVNLHSHLWGLRGAKAVERWAVAARGW
jgi:D-serine deaminase-like pyridoxal phosphate-dependent protein